MQAVVHDSELAAVLVQGHDDSSVGSGSPEDLIVARIRIPAPHSLDVVAVGLEHVDSRLGDAGVEEKPHGVTTC